MIASIPAPAEIDALPGILRIDAGEIGLHESADIGWRMRVVALAAAEQDALRPVDRVGDHARVLAGGALAGRMAR